MSEGLIARANIILRGAPRPPPPHPRITSGAGSDPLPVRGERKTKCAMRYFVYWKPTEKSCPHRLTSVLLVVSWVAGSTILPPQPYSSAKLPGVSM